MRAQACSISQPLLLAPGTRDAKRTSCVRGIELKEARGRARWKGLATVVHVRRRSPAPLLGVWRFAVVGNGCFRRFSAASCPGGMSRSSKVVLGLSVVLTVGTVVGVHLRQKLEQQRLRDGVLRDIERQNRKKENVRLLEEQIILTEHLEAERKKILLAKGSQKT
ncbi:uncharacterized protein LOC127548457 [Antechinus flavipes]|uniref:uncharacterized protein LOC127548457 n=1 Tax=Antechinus flavipes TaxID=38775 RepID=UPI0022357020|nr:uncharacterized protein LOC127548457 [Antechinus flavipes]